MAEGRLLVGLGAGNMALCNAYVSQATTLKERTAAVANLAATGVGESPFSLVACLIPLQGLGIIFGPLLGIAFGGVKPGYTLYVACCVSGVSDPRAGAPSRSTSSVPPPFAQCCLS